MSLTYAGSSRLLASFFHPSLRFRVVKVNKHIGHPSHCLEMFLLLETYNWVSLF